LPYYEGRFIIVVVCTGRLQRKRRLLVATLPISPLVIHFIDAFIRVLTGQGFQYDQDGCCTQRRAHYCTRQIISPLRHGLEERNDK
jgi:hypothetical protein